VWPRCQTKLAARSGSYRVIDERRTPGLRRGEGTVQTFAVNIVFGNGQIEHIAGAPTRVIDGAADENLLAPAWDESGTG
jgi:hypothetical protein